MLDYSFIISPIRATGQTPAPRIPRFAARRFLSATFRTIGTTSFPSSSPAARHDGRILRRLRGDQPCPEEYVFIDTNIYLDFYRVSKGDLNKLGILRNGFADPDIANRFVLCVNVQNRDEYYRNRVNVIEATLKEFHFKKIDVSGLISNQWPSINEQFVKAQSQIERIVQSLKDKTRQSLYDEGLEADRLIGSMMKSTQASGARALWG